MSRSDEQGELRLDPEGDLVGAQINDTLDRLRTELLDTPGGPVVLDLRRALLVDSMGFGLVVSLYRDCAAAGRTFRVEVGDVTVRQIFQQMTLDRLMEVKYIPPEEG